MRSTLDHENFLGFVRLLLKVQRVKAALPNGEEGNVLERAFYHGLLGLRLFRTVGNIDCNRVIKLTLAAALTAYLREVPEDEFAPELFPFRREIHELMSGSSKEARLIGAHGERFNTVVAGRMDDPELSSFIEFLDQVRAIRRVIPVPGRPTPENDAEHSTSVALCAWYLMTSHRESWGSNIARACIDALIHDVKEAYSGDTPAFGDPQLLATKAAREEAGLAEVEAKFPWLGQMVREYEERDDPASKIVYEVDKVVPVAIIGLAGGDGRWHDPRYAFDRELTRLQSTCSAPLFGPLGTDLLEFFEERIIYLRAARVRA